METRTRRLLLLLKQHAHDALKREGGGVFHYKAQREAADATNQKEKPPKALLQANRMAAVFFEPNLLGVS